MKKLVVLATVAVMSVVTLVGCGSKTGDVVNDSNKEVLGSEVEETNDVVVEHSKGTITVSGEVKKAVVFDLGILDTINALDIDVEVAVPTGSLVSYLSKYETSVNAGGIKEPDMETIFSFEPDVIFISGRQADFYDELNKIAPTIYVDLSAATYMEDFQRNVRMVADIFNKEELAETKLAEIQKIIEDTKKVTSSSDQDALIILTNDGNISAYGLGSRFGIIHEVLGVKPADENIEVSTHGQEASYEYIAEVDADILFVVDRTVVAGGTVNAAQTLSNDLINNTQAAKNDKIISLDPESWYVSGGGLTSVAKMVSEVEAAVTK